MDLLRFARLRRGRTEAKPAYAGSWAPNLRYSNPSQLRPIWTGHPNKELPRKRSNSHLLSETALAGLPANPVRRPQARTLGRKSDDYTCPLVPYASPGTA